MELTDFLGKQYGPGDLVIYGAMSGRSVNVVVGRVLDVYRVYWSNTKWGWVKLAEGEEPPPPPEYADKPLSTHVKVRVQPLRAARWKQHHGRKRYIDTRSGKGINPDAPSGKHILKPPHFVYADGREYDYKAEQAKWQLSALGRASRNTFDGYFRRTHHVNYGEPGVPSKYPLHESDAAKTQLWYVSRIYQPWVQEVSNGPEPVTLDITDNIVKWEGELP